MRMKQREYRLLLGRIKREFSGPLDWNLLELCQACDPVLFGEQTEEKLVSLLRDEVKDNIED